MSSPCHPWRVLFDSISPFFLYWSFLLFSFYFLHSELYSELDNLIVMESLCCSANKESGDAYDVSTSLTDKEFKETIKNARKKLETSVAPAMPCKIMKNCGSGGSNKIKTKVVCIVEVDESTRMRMGNSIPHYHQDHIAGKGDKSLQHTSLFLCLKL